MPTLVVGMPVLTSGHCPNRKGHAHASVGMAPGRRDGAYSLRRFLPVGRLCAIFQMGNGHLSTSLSSGGVRCVVP